MEFYRSGFNRFWCCSRISLGPFGHEKLMRAFSTAVFQNPQVDSLFRPSAGLDVKCEACQRFFRDGLTISFTKILTDEAVSGWKFEIHVSQLSLLQIMHTRSSPVNILIFVFDWSLRENSSVITDFIFFMLKSSVETSLLSLTQPHVSPCESFQQFQNTNPYCLNEPMPKAGNCLDFIFYWKGNPVFFFVLLCFSSPAKLCQPSAPQRCIINNTHRLVELCVAKLSQDWFPLLELLAMATNPHCKFHIYNGTRPSETVPAGAQLTDDELFARPPDPRSPKVKRAADRKRFGFIYRLRLFKGARKEPCFRPTF